MMRLTAMKLANFRGWREGNVELDRDLVVVVGRNGSGKSSTLNAIEWCLFGKQIEKKASGIAERADWEVTRRGGGAPTWVALEFAFDAGKATVARRRDPDAAARAEDEFTVDVSDGRRLAGAQAEAWMREVRFPDWDTWRRACCQHQEIARARLTDANDRSLILSSLLGLDEFDRLNGVLREQQPRKLVERLDQELLELEKVVLYRLSQPSEDLFECERRLEALGIERARISLALSLELGRAAVERARGLAERLRITVELPTASSDADEPALRKWAEAWVALVRKESKLAERLNGATKKRAKIAAEIEQLEPAEERVRKAKELLATELRERGDEPTRKRLLAEAASSVKEAEKRLREENRTLALMREALEILRETKRPEHCPVCESDVTGLGGRLDELLRQGTGERVAALTSERDNARERAKLLETSGAAFARTVESESSARKAYDARRETLSALLTPGRLRDGLDLLAAAREEDQALAREIAELEGVLSSLEPELEEHRKDADRLKELNKWRAAAKRAQQRADLSSSPEWKAFQEALDAAACFAADLDALGAMAREAQEERSSSREAEVNRSLAGFAKLIAGDSADLDVRVRVKRTPKGLGYDIEDSGGGRALSIQNQASLNAISLALLFAQAEERARSNQPTWVVLDDPEQSLDNEHRQGLARAIDKIGRVCPVIVGLAPGELADGLWTQSALPRRLIQLAERDAKQGVRIQSQEQR
jgi:DNA repair exonuclease SbcCD ATPase subunit